jgi:hypothetical protein
VAPVTLVPADLTGSAASVAPVNRYLLDPGLENAKSSRASAGMDSAFTQRLRALYLHAE